MLACCWTWRLSDTLASSANGQNASTSRSSPAAAAILRAAADDGGRIGPSPRCRPTSREPQIPSRNSTIGDDTYPVLQGRSRAEGRADDLSLPYAHATVRRRGCDTRSMMTVGEGRARSAALAVLTHGRESAAACRVRSAEPQQVRTESHGSGSPMRPAATVRAAAKASSSQPDQQFMERRSIAIVRRPTSTRRPGLAHGGPCTR